jgi:hypothetical protein
MWRFETASHVRRLAPTGCSNPACDASQSPADAAAIDRHLCRGRLIFPPQPPSAARSARSMNALVSGKVYRHCRRTREVTFCSQKCLFRQRPRESSASIAQFDRPIGRAVEGDSEDGFGRTPASCGPTTCNSRWKMPRCSANWAAPAPASTSNSAGLWEPTAATCCGVTSLSVPALTLIAPQLSISSTVRTSLPSTAKCNAVSPRSSGV